MDRRERVKAILSAKDAVPWAIAATLFLAVAGDVMTPKLANSFLVVVVLAIAWGVYFNARLEDDPVRVRLFWTFLVTIGPALFCYFALWTPVLPAKLDLVYRANILPVTPYPVEKPNRLVTHQVPVLCDMINQSPRNMSLRFTLLVQTTVDGKEINFPAYGRWKYKADEPTSSVVLNLPREKTILDGLWTFNLPDPQRAGFDFDSWDEVGLTGMRLRITDEVSGLVVYTDDLMNYPQGPGRSHKAAFQDFRAKGEPDKVAQPNADSTDGTVAEQSADDDGLTALLIPRGANVRTSVSPLPQNPNQRPANPSDLDFYFFPLWAASFDDWVQYATVTVTNRTPQKMHLELWGYVDYWTDSGEPKRFGTRAEWNFTKLKGRTGGQDFIQLDEFETKKGRLILFLGKPVQGLSKWFLNANKNVYIEVFDTVTGKRAAFRGWEGYPVGQMPSPLPRVERLLALEFPATASESQNLPALETLDLLARAQLSGYDNDNRVLFTADLTNRSSNRMKLQINLLTRTSVDDKEWRTFRAVIVPSREKNKNHLDYYALDFGPGDVADCSLVFANTGFKNKAGEELDASPSVSLLEIFDEVSRKKIWCAIEPGYPPGADMRSADIQPPPAIPE